MSKGNVWRSTKSWRAGDAHRQHHTLLLFPTQEPAKTTLGWFQNKTRGAQQHSSDTTANLHLVFESLMNSWKENLPRAHKTSINSFWITKSPSCSSCQVRAHTWATLPCSIHWALSHRCLTSLVLRGPSLAFSMFPAGIFDAFSVCLFPFFHSYLGTSASLSPQSHLEKLLGFTPPTWHQGSSKLNCEILYQVMTGKDVHLSTPDQIPLPAAWGSALPAGSTGDLEAAPGAQGQGLQQKCCVCNYSSWEFN